MFWVCLCTCVLAVAADPLTSIPRVRSWKSQNSSCSLGPSPLTISFNDESLHDHADTLALELVNLAGIAANVTSKTDSLYLSDSVAIRLLLNQSMIDSENHFYEYTVSVSCTQITVSGGSVYAVAHGTATILQQLRSETPGHALISAGNITDFSTVEWTGFMYDLSRDPVDPLTFQSLIDLCRFYKMRFLHVFATAEAGWRLPIAAVFLFVFYFLL